MATVPRSQSLWRHGAFMRVWAGSTISGVGDQITGLALPRLVLQLTHLTWVAMARFSEIRKV